MEVTTNSDGTVSPRHVGRYTLVAALLLSPFFLPVFFSVTYVRVLKTVILLVVFSQLVRISLSALLAFSDPEDPPDLPAEATLPSVSVVIPAYDEAAVLPETIEVCRDADYPADRLEVVICYEAASTDGTAEIAERAAAEDERFVALEHAEDGGTKARATNYAASEAAGDVVAVIDADHHFEAGAVRRAARWFHHDPDTWCVKGRCYGRNPGASLVSLHATVDRHVTEKADLFARDLLGSFTIFGGSGGFFRREVFEDLGGFDESVLVEDVDMSARIHDHGKELRVDPKIVTYEENPTTIRGWWHQRKRWARGWQQVSTRYLGRVPSSSGMTLKKRADAMYTFSYNMLLPFLIVGMPLPLLDLAFTSTSAFIPHSKVLWTIMGAFPVLTTACVFLQDRRDGYDHHPREYLAALTVGAFLFVQAFVHMVAFLDEFVFRRQPVWVKTERSGDDATAPGAD